MRVLVACEWSGTVRDAFIMRGHEAMSCDLLPTEQQGPHYQGDVRDVLDYPWDLMIAHPPCTHLSVSGARHFGDKVLTGKQQAAASFFMRLARANIPHIAIENPICIISRLWRKPDQIVQPWMFGHGETKATCLWLKNTPPPSPHRNSERASGAGSPIATKPGSRKVARQNVQRLCKSNGRSMEQSMNLDQMPSSVEAAELAHDRQGEKLEAELERMQAIFPIEDFEAYAWKVAIDNHELLHYLVADSPMTVLNVILSRTGTTPDWLNVDSVESERLLGRLIALWIEDQQRLLQEAQIEASR